PARDDAPGSRAKAIGGCGFKGKPAADGTVEIGYSMLPEFQCAGYATEAAGALVRWAFSHAEVARVIAETYPELRPSIRVLEKNGFRFIGDGSEERVIRYALTREEYEAAPRRTE
ncbi:MAG: GNAT family N-acetyltransferase, partial [Pyrinomonadaceae bacterium]|nr:GNAT family N-acetyltransferase [Pyrinomonadaceae bacterium]